MSWLWLMFGFKGDFLLYYEVTDTPVPFPVFLLALNGTVVCLTTTSAIEHFAAFYLPARLAAVQVVAQSHLLHALDLFVFLLQAGARNTLPAIFNE